MSTFEERYWSKVQKSDGCWLWTGARIRNGYGQIGLNGKVVYAHRVAYVLANGPIPTGLWVLHHCDVKHCVRPEHLYAGTVVENVLDALARDRWPRGDRHAARINSDYLKRGWVTRRKHQTAMSPRSS